MPHSHSSKITIDREYAQSKILLALARVQQRAGGGKLAEISGLQQRAEALSDEALAVLEHIADMSPPLQYQQTMVELLKIMPEAGIIALKGKESEWIAHTDSALKLCHAVQHSEVSPNLSPMLVPMLKFALDHANGLKRISALGLLDQWVDAYRFAPEGAEILMEMQNASPQDHDPVYLIGELPSKIKPELIAPPFQLRDVAALDPDVLRELLSEQTLPPLMHELPYDYNRFDGGEDDEIEELIKDEQAPSRRVPTPLGEIVIAQITAAREEHHRHMLHMAAAVLEPFAPLNDYRRLYRRWMSLAPTTDEAEQLRHFILKTVWHPNGDAPFKPVDLGEVRIARPDTARMEALVTVLEEIPEAQIHKFYEPKTQAALIQGLEKVGSFLTRYVPSDSGHTNRDWEGRFIAELEYLKIEPASKAYMLLQEVLKTRPLNHMMMFEPDKLRVLLDAQERACEEVPDGNQPKKLLPLLIDTLRDHHQEMEKSGLGGIVRGVIRTMNGGKVEEGSANKLTMKEMLALPADQLKRALQVLQDNPKGHMAKTVFKTLIMEMQQAQQTTYPVR